MLNAQLVREGGGAKKTPGMTEHIPAIIARVSGATQAEDA